MHWVGLEINEEQFDIKTHETTRKTKQPASGHVEFTWEFKFQLQ